MQNTEPSLRTLRPHVRCPHCWDSFAPEQILWISESPDLLGDARLGRTAQVRFLPSRFDARCFAMDAHNFPCHKIACPNCHLALPRPFLEKSPFSISVVGAPASGKSYFLASMTWQLRKIFPKFFKISYTDADSEMNYRIQQYETTQFMQTDSNDLVTIEKTDVYGDAYNTVEINGQQISYPQPFTFSMTPMEGHPKFLSQEKFSRVLCLYDNAGESFLPGADQTTHPVTRHLASSDAIFFMFDPTQDPRFRAACKNQSNDPQLENNSDVQVRRSPLRQEIILVEMIQRVQTFAGLGIHKKHQKPLIIVPTKFDAWGHLLKRVTKLSEPYKFLPDGSICAVDRNLIQNISEEVGQLLKRFVPEIPGAAEIFAENVWYIPVSATGLAPTVDQQTGALGFRPDSLKPVWVEVPVLYTLIQAKQGLIQTFIRK
ncbi:MAG: hypothetical protein ACRC10_08275 [Thermoguttaceae bacterium]